MPALVDQKGIGGSCLLLVAQKLLFALAVLLLSICFRQATTFFEFQCLERVNKGGREREREREKDRKTERQKDRKTERQKDRKTERQKDRKTERQKERKKERKKDRKKERKKNKKKERKEKKKERKEKMMYDAVFFPIRGFQAVPQTQRECRHLRGLCATRWIGETWSVGWCTKPRE